VELKKHDPWHAKISIDGGEILEARFLGRGSMVLDVECYCCVYVVHIAY